MNQAKAVDIQLNDTVAWCNSGYYLPERLSFTFDPLFHAGAYYVQEASSMFLEQAIKTYIKEPVTCLDLCAAPGGKSTHLLSVLPTDSLLVSNEVIRSRSNILLENITKWGNPNTIVTNNDPRDIGKLTHLFDLIVTDVPCSGEGMFRKDKDSIGEWSVANVNLCAERQRRIISDIWKALKPGGLLIYSTCTYNTEENEDNIHFIINELGAEAMSVPIQKDWKITGALKYDYPVYRFFPHKTKGEGLFMAVLRKTEQGADVLNNRRKFKKDNRKPPAVPSEINNWLLQSGKYQVEMNNSMVNAFPAEHLDTYRLLKDQLRVISAGINVGEIKGKDIIPDQSLAMNAALDKQAFTNTELSWEEAVKYLKKETLNLPETISKGYVLVSYKGLPLGFLKQLGNRANNLYPQEWRIRTGYLPDRIITLDYQYIK